MINKKERVKNMEVKKINTSAFKIEKNIISFEHTLIQISNISQVSIAPLPMRQFNFWSIIILVIGCVMQSIYSMESIGIWLIIGALCYIAWILFIMYSESKIVNLNITMNSGKVYSIKCSDESFLKLKVKKVLEECFNSNSSQFIQIDFAHCRISNSPINLGNGNEVNYK